MRWISELAGVDLFLVDVSIKAGLVLGLAWTAAQVLRWRRGSAASRHLVWAVALGGVLALPLLVCTLPPISIVLPRPASPVPLPAEPLAVAGRGPEMAAGPAAGVQTTPIGSPGVVATSGIAATVESAAFPPEPPVSLPASTGVSWLLVVWLGGAILALAPVTLGLVRLWRIGRSAPRVTAGPLHDALGATMARLGMKGPIRLFESPARSMPMTWGLCRPAILLPAEAERWPGDRLEAVLLHELAHVRRRDCWIQVLAQVSRGMHWFNPLSWLAERQLRSLQEQACDDLVLAGGFEAADYAEHLLEISARCRPAACIPGLAMSRASRLERRLGSILSSRWSRRPVTRGRLALAAVAGFTLLLPLSIASFELAAAGDVAAEEAPPDAPPADTAPDLTQVLAELRDKIAEQYVNPVDEKAIVRHALEGMIGALQDPYSNYLTPEMLADMEKHVGGSLIGIGVQLEVVDRRVRIVTPLPDSPALHAGLEPGDVILQVDDASTEGLELREVIGRIAGPVGTSVRLLIGREPDRELAVSIVRSPIKLPTVKGFRRGEGDRWDFLLDPAHRIGYVQIAHLGSATSQELRDAVNGLEAHGGLRGLILDLRSCPGGLLESAVAVSNLFLARGTIVSIHGRSGPPSVIGADGSGAHADTPLVVLVNGQTASAAEIVVGALQDNQRALVVGTRTLGKGSVQTLIKLSAMNGAIKLTTARYFLPGGRNIDRRGTGEPWGIDPDPGHFVPMDKDQSLRLLERREAREIIGGGAPHRAAAVAAASPGQLEREGDDPQLAAALGAIRTRLESGQFAPGHGWTPAEIELFLKREDLQRRRDSLAGDLERLDRELSDLDQGPGAKR